MCSIVRIAITLVFISESHTGFAHKILTERLIESQGLNYERHVVTTSDGYLLTMFRIPGPRDYPPVVLVHGMFSSSEDYLMTGNSSLGIMMQKAGFDIWLVNLRYTESAKHISINRDDVKYWDFGCEEHSAIDLPESIDYVLTTTNFKKATLVTLSSSSPFYIMMLNERPDMITKIAVHVALAPVVFVRHHRNLIAVFEKFLELIRFLGIRWTHSTSYGDVTGIPGICLNRPPKKNICYEVLFWVYGYDWDQWNWDLHEQFLSRYRAFTRKQIIFIVRTVTSGVLAKFDYGRDENLKKYGSESPPLYDWSTGIAPIVIFYGKNDLVSTKEDVNMILENLNRSKAQVFVKRPKRKSFSHMDFVLSINASIPLFSDVIDSIKELVAHQKFD